MTPTTRTLRPHLVARLAIATLALALVTTGVTACSVIEGVTTVDQPAAEPATAIEPTGDAIASDPTELADETPAEEPTVITEPTTTVADSTPSTAEATPAPAPTPEASQPAAPEPAAPEPAASKLGTVVDLPGPDDRPLLTWQPIDGAERYVVWISTIDGQPYWSWTGSTTTIALGGLPRLAPDAPGPRLSPGMIWLIEAIGADGAAIDIDTGRFTVPT